MNFPGDFGFLSPSRPIPTSSWPGSFREKQQQPAAPPLTIKNLPYSVDSALALPVGSVVTVPIHGRMAMDVVGPSWTRTAAHSAEIGSHLTTSVLGSLSAVRQGTLVGEGRFQLQFIRLPDQQVRVRVFAGSDFSGNMGGMGTALGSVSYAFIPLAIVDRARSIRQRVEEFGKSILKRKSAAERAIDLYEELPGKLKLIFDHLEPGEGVQETDSPTGCIHRGWRLECALPGGALQSLENTIQDRVNQMLQQVTSPGKTGFSP